MVFNSLVFLIFGILFFAFWPLMRKNKTSRWIYITSASFIFYGWWDWRFLFLIIGSGLIDYICGLAIYKKEKNRKLYLIISLVGNLGSLAIFKYSYFIVNIINDISVLLNVDFNLSIPKFTILLPVGISFYTFQSLSYTIDVYRKRLNPTKNIFHFFSFLSMFPQLVAGPIVRAKDLLIQLEKYKKPNPIEKWNATKLIVFGLFQKVVIADNLSSLIDAAFENKTAYDGTIFWWVVMIAFSFQIYCDFSGYSLIARGLAKLMGYHFKMNFNHPYLSKNMRTFWQKWHISLSTWFRDYVYIPMGGSKKGKRYAFIALLTTMFLSGIWHGANYTYIMWAFIHIVWLQIDRVTKWTKKAKNTSIIFIIIAFIQALIAWVYFRAENIQQGNTIIKKLFSYSEADLSFLNYYSNPIIFLSLAIFIEFMIFIRKNYSITNIMYKKANLDILSISIAVLFILFLRGEGQQFIYFQF